MPQRGNAPDAGLAYSPYLRRQAGRGIPAPRRSRGISMLQAKTKRAFRAALLLGAAWGVQATPALSQAQGQSTVETVVVTGTMLNREDLTTLRRSP
jgi:hypothetical protein